MCYLQQTKKQKHTIPNLKEFTAIRDARMLIELCYIVL